MKKLFIQLFAYICFISNAQKQAEVNLELHDGNIIKGTTSINDINLSTAYGKLVIPVAKVNKIGYGKDKAATEKALQQIKLMNNGTNDDIRKNSYDELIKMGSKALFAFEEFFNDPKNQSNMDYAGDYTPENAYEEIKASNGITDQMNAEDVVTIDNQYNIGGSYEFSKMDVKTEYGTLSIPKEKIKTVDLFIKSADGSGDVYLKVMANKHISGNQNGGWLKTGITLKAGQKFSVTATGEVTLASLSNGVYKPDGSNKASGGTDYIGGDYDGAANYPSYGMLVYKIGEGTLEAKKAGAKFSGVAKNGGMLYLSIYETVYNNTNKGSYSVKVSTAK
jgi:hypothetical protein